jgi:phage portal protein BeeE
LSDVASGLREIFSDNERANFSAMLLKNAGVPPFVISPKVNQSNLQDADRKRIGDAFLRKTMGDERGKPVVMSNAIDVHKTGFTPIEMDLSKLSRVPEETISSLTGIPAVVLQFGARLERSTFSNYGEAREAVYESVIVPLWVYVGDEVTLQLLAEFDRSEKLEARFNTAGVRVLQEDENKLHIRVSSAYRSGIMKRSEARSKIGLLVEESDNVYFVEPKKELSESNEKVN